MFKRNFAENLDVIDRVACPGLGDKKRFGGEFVQANVLGRRCRGTAGVNSRPDSPPSP
ncbi:hypothetical protein BN6_06830 [Saccharothrix espanaensis DSM 44229]|uniref:Uncharacterized protein n=1 Tax=Saccharothrix espanaensis (strain ATCC 51144 / DSM 44229 / JCM 9112 / NBRC 15066 / NRRL 15764) TaxID=1179773 RepID=K0JQQ2_SACES|nr:hypothetical protein BN6_06830 [Saccharothrix espanaensis DSM 44229]